METERLLQRDPVLSSDDERLLPVEIAYYQFGNKIIGRRVGSSIKLKIPDDRVDVCPNFFYIFYTFRRLRRPQKAQ